MKYLAGLAIACALSFSSSAATLVSNLANTGAGSATVQNTFWQAQKFTTDGSTYDVNSVTVTGSRHPATANVAVYIYAHDSMNNAPVTGATGFGELDASGFGTSAGDYVFPAVGTISLQANTSYWVVMQPDNVNGALWEQTSDTSSTGSGTLDNVRASSNNSGSSWSSSSGGSNLKIEVDVLMTPVALQKFSIE